MRGMGERVEEEVTLTKADLPLLTTSSSKLDDVSSSVALAASRLTMRAAMIGAQ